jgi:hypothetical protein
MDFPLFVPSLKGSLIKKKSVFVVIIIDRGSLDPRFLELIGSKSIESATSL